MKLTVKNFGPIQSAEVDVKPMTVFVGPSNTGKSYLAMLVYITAKTLKSDLLRNFIFHFKNRIVDKTETTQMIRAMFSSSVKTIHELWEEQGIYCFGEEWEKLIRHDGVQPSITISDKNKEITLNLLSPEKDKFPPPDFIKDLTEEVWALFKSDNAPRVWSWEFGEFNQKVNEVVDKHIHNLLDFFPNTDESRGPQGDMGRKYMEMHINTTHYLPAVRGGLMQSHRILASLLIGRAPTTGLSKEEIPLLNGVLADFLQKLLIIGNEHQYDLYGLRLRENRRIQSIKDISELSQTIEQDIMRGTIETKILTTRYPDFRYNFTDLNAESRDISLVNASSSISELAPIALFIRYYLLPGDLFIVEEPEAHLHPKAQRAIAGVLADLAKAGVYVLVTTHSDIILEQISNFIHADNIPGDKMLNREASKHKLPVDKIRCYSFKRFDRQGTTVKAIEFDEETGILTEDHLDEASDLYNQGVDLFNDRERISEQGTDNDN